MFGDFFFNRVFGVFVEGIIVSFENIEKVVVVEIRYDGGCFVRDGGGSVGGGRMDVACLS